MPLLAVISKIVVELNYYYKYNQTFSNTEQLWLLTTEPLVVKNGVGF